MIFQAEFYVCCLTRRERCSLTNFRARKARENLRREKGAEEIRSFKKRKGTGKKKGMPRGYDTILFCSGRQECDKLSSFFVVKRALLKFRVICYFYHVID